MTLLTTDEYKHWYSLGFVAQHENMRLNLLFSTAALALLLSNKQQILEIKEGVLGALCQTVCETTTSSSRKHFKSGTIFYFFFLKRVVIIKLPIISIHCLPEEIFEIGQLISRQMDDDWIFVCLTLEDMRSSGQQYGSVSSERTGARIQGYISLQLLLQQPEEAHTNTLSETVPATCQSAN